MKRFIDLAGLIILLIISADSVANTYFTKAFIPYESYLDTLLPPQLALTGTVKNQQGQPLQNVKVGAGNTIVTFTDSAGAFNLLIEDKPTILTFNLAKMVTVKRSYHPSMQEKSFNIIMQKDSCKYCARISEAIHKKN